MNRIVTRQQTITNSHSKEPLWWSGSNPKIPSIQSCHTAVSTTKKALNEPSATSIQNAGRTRRFTDPPSSTHEPSGGIRLNGPRTRSAVLKCQSYLIGVRQSRTGERCPRNCGARCADATSAAFCRSRPQYAHLHDTTSRAGGRCRPAIAAAARLRADAGSNTEPYNELHVVCSTDLKHDPLPDTGGSFSKRPFLGVGGVVHGDQVPRPRRSPVSCPADVEALRDPQRGTGGEGYVCNIAVARVHRYRQARPHPLVAEGVDVVAASHPEDRALVVCRARLRVGRCGGGGSVNGSALVGRSAGLSPSP
jgi:hypothetical protein